MSVNIAKLKNWFDQKLASLNEIDSQLVKKQHDNDTPNAYLKKVIKVLSDFENTLDTSMPSNLTETENKIISYIDNKGLFSDKGKELLNKAIYDLNIYKPNHAKGLKKELENIRKKANVFSGAGLNRVKDFLKGTLNEDLSWTDGVVVKLNGVNHTSSMALFSEEINHWFAILKTFSKIEGNNSTTFNIHEIKTAPLMLTVRTSGGLVRTLGKTVNHILGSMNKSYEIKKHAVELKKIKSQELKTVIEELEAKSVIDAEAVAHTIAAQLLSDIQYPNEKKHVVKRDLETAIQYLVKFFDEGGETNLLLAPKENNGEGDARLKEKLNTRQKQLVENKSDLEQLLGTTNVRLRKIPKAVYESVV